MQGRRFKVEAYKSVKPPLQCFNCQGLNHMAYMCSKDDKCFKCAGNHPSKECPNKDKDVPPVCANCQGDHMANSTLCPKVQEAKKSQEVKTLTYATVTAKKADQSECLRISAWSAFFAVTVAYVKVFTSWLFLAS